MLLQKRELTNMEEKKRFKTKRSIKFFDNPAYWNLDADELRPLRAFLDQHIQ